MDGIIVLVVMVLIIVGVVALVVAGNKKLAEFKKACSERGWMVEQGNSAADGGFSLRVSGSTSGVNWEYAFVRAGRSANKGSQTQYGRVTVASGALPSDAVMIFPHEQKNTELGAMFAAFDKLGGLGKMIIEIYVLNILGGDRADVDTITRMRPVEAGSDAVRQRFIVLSTSEDAAAKVLRRSEGALVDFVNDTGIPASRRKVATLVWSKGLTLTVQDAITDANYLEALTNLAATLANSTSGW